jgi:hypothetical protein
VLTNIILKIWSVMLTQTVYQNTNIQYSEIRPYVLLVFCLFITIWYSLINRCSFSKVTVPHNTPEGPGGRGIALLFLDLGARRGGWSAPRPGRSTPGKDPVPIVQEAGWAAGPVWTGAENLTPTGIRSPDRPAHSQSLYRLSYPAPQLFQYTLQRYR